MGSQRLPHKFKGALEFTGPIELARYMKYRNDSWGTAIHVRVHELEIWFSYSTPIAFRRAGEMLFLRKNRWGRTTEKHLRAVEPEESDPFYRRVLEDPVFDKTLTYALLHPGERCQETLDSALTIVLDAIRKAHRHAVLATKSWDHGRSHLDDAIATLKNAYEYIPKRLREPEKPIKTLLRRFARIAVEDP